MLANLGSSLLVYGLELRCTGSLRAYVHTEEMARVIPSHIN